MLTQLKIKELCKAKGTTLIALSEKTGISRVSLSLISSGKQKPSFDTLEKIAEALDVGLAQLFVAPSAEISFQCPNCGKTLKVKIEDDQRSTD